MTPIEIIEALRKGKISIYLVGGNLKVAGDKGSLSPELVDILRKHKAELVKFLSNQPREADLLLDEWREYARGAWTGILLEAERQEDVSRMRYAQEVLKSIGGII